ncbi:ABC transporter permease [Haloplasma contractile]|uniref:Protein LplB n=1 Tax=Haloplasma contractile SSD-17B TaxID=1033810 RepID=U2DZM4_9MOLU|nr:ABC transporter permease subunit [Haloplasma contractile]ERJ13652.1 Protein LplB [Haloplasma contractile SSD-17B]
MEQMNVKQNGEYDNNQSKKAKRKTGFRKYLDLYPFLIPAMIFALIFAYIPMAGISIAFKDYKLFYGLGDPILAFKLSRWVGLEHFITLFNSEKFFEVLTNTLIISVYKIVFLFPIPVVIAILITEAKNKLFNRSIQTVMYLPHFISWAVVAGLFMTFLAPFGSVNNFLIKIGLMSSDNPIKWFQDTGVFRGVLVASAGWKEIGWSAIVYIAAITAINPTLYEAAKIDGASKLQQIWHITIPGITSTMAVLFVIRLGYLMEAGFEQIIVMYNSTVYEVADIIGTYVYREGLGGGEYSFTTAVGLFNSVVALVLVLSGNYLMRKYFDKGIW